MYALISYALLLLIVLFLIYRSNEGIFDFYMGMPGIPKTFISTGYIRNPAESIGGQVCL